MATQLKDLASIEAILDEMTVEEKASMVVGATGFYAPGCEKYGIPRTLWLDGGTGFNLMQWKMEEAYQNYEKKMAEQGTPVNREDFGGMGGLAVAMTALLRSQRIPTKLVVGYSGQQYHAWISVYLEETGWMDKTIYFDGNSWVLVDPTLGATNKSSDVKRYVGDGSNYLVKYQY